MDKLEEDHHRKMMEKDSKIKQMEFNLIEKDQEMMKKVQGKEGAIKILESEIDSLKEQIESKAVEKDSIIKNLREANNRMGGELRDKITIISRLNSPQMTPHYRSPSQSYVQGLGDNRHEE